MNETFFLAALAKRDAWSAVLLGKMNYSVSGASFDQELWIDELSAYPYVIYKVYR